MRRLGSKSSNKGDTSQGTENNATEQSNLDQSLQAVSLDDIDATSIVQNRKKKTKKSEPSKEAPNGARASPPDAKPKPKGPAGMQLSNHIDATGHGGRPPAPSVGDRTINRQQSRVVVHFPENFVPGHGQVAGRAGGGGVGWLEHLLGGGGGGGGAPGPSRTSVLGQYHKRKVSGRMKRPGMESIPESESDDEDKRRSEATDNETDHSADNAPQPTKKKKLKTPRTGSRIRGGLKKIKPITDVHEQYQLTMGMMVGMRCSVGREDTLQDAQLALVDFMQVDKYKFKPAGNPGGENPTPPHNLGATFKFKDYSPKIFAHIRARFNVDRTGYMLSVAGNQRFLEFISNSKSGQFFFYSHDGRYMIKTMSSEETKFLRRILPHYFQHISQYPATLLTRFYGMHRVKMRHLNRKVHFVIMESVFNTVKTIHTLYDLKGSTKGRSAKPEEKAAGAPQKDKDLLAAGRKFHMGAACKEKFMASVRADVEFLKKMKIMDYSLLVGIHDRQLQYEADVAAAAADEGAQNGEALQPQDLAQLDGFADQPTGGHRKDAALSMASGLDHSHNTDERSPAKYKRPSNAEDYQSLMPMSSFDLSPLAPVNRPSAVHRQTTLSPVQSPERKGPRPGGGGGGSPAPPRSHAPPSPGGEPSKAGPRFSFSAGSEPRGSESGVGGLWRRLFGGGGGPAADEAPSAGPGEGRVHVVGADGTLSRSRAATLAEVLAVTGDGGGSLAGLGDGLLAGGGGGFGGGGGRGRPPRARRRRSSSGGAAAGGEDGGGEVAAAAAAAARGGRYLVEDGGRAGSGGGGGGGGAIEEASEEEEEDSDSELDSEEDDMLPSVPVEMSGTSIGMQLPMHIADMRRTGHQGPQGSGRSEGAGSHFSSAGSQSLTSSAKNYPPNDTRSLRLTNRRDRGIYSAKLGEEPGREIFYLGIIDILQQYNMRKSVETVLRGVVSDVRTISAVSPEMYGDRFVKFMEDNTC